MSEHDCLYCNGTKIGVECDQYGTPTGKIGKCYSCSGTGKQSFRFDTNAEAEEWRKTHPVGIYGQNRLWLGCCYEGLKDYLQHFKDRDEYTDSKSTLDFDDWLDVKYGIERFEI